MKQLRNSKIKKAFWAVLPVLYLLISSMMGGTGLG
ncbi:Protein of unknown function [Lactobacillus pasteurii DSM 23907 = CRBIP 24.76]|uniref:Uncharacterized protein n=1 Tax=Lactobacillus pasteurii DSM 23907 = CRBIP 24.76 TaxID=1423790 RepID=I7LBZ1_9LACO|nr:Protein of unknown function [Lactobacillus pasteurii DSM 23907 = CRBIP 24.76]